MTDIYKYFQTNSFLIRIFIRKPILHITIVLIHNSIHTSFSPNYNILTIASRSIPLIYLLLDFTNNKNSLPREILRQSYSIVLTFLGHLIWELKCALHRPSVRLTVNFLTFSSSFQEPLGKFQPNLVQSIFVKGNVNLVK